MPYPKVCPQCGLCFSGNRKGAIYCSIACANTSTTAYALQDPKGFFLKYVDVPHDPATQCWIWKGIIDEYGYGKLHTKKQRNARAHRIAYTLFHGNIPKGMHVLHSCDTPACVSPHHLRVGNPAENARDRVEHGRQRRGATHPDAVLTEEHVVAILHAFHTGGIRQHVLATTYHVHPVTIHDVVHRKTWAHVLPDLFPSPHCDGRALVPSDVVLRVRTMRESGATYETIAKQFKLSVGQVHRIVNRLAYTYIS